VKLKESKKGTNTRVNEMNEGVSGGEQVERERTLPRTKEKLRGKVNESRGTGKQK
jgi:hypothetical protein